MEVWERGLIQSPAKGPNFARVPLVQIQLLLPENFKMKKFENVEVLSYNIYIKVEQSILYGSVVQLVRMPPCHGGGLCAFESRRSRHGV